ncbi:unnamed protein product [Lupinus luteus]|uniref:AP2/ERF domain-containing protein n=1 Tax=Lupinus luteus TaxID=3873 RepID=A0AAV1XLS3_LUPLU
MDDSNSWLNFIPFSPVHPSLSPQFQESQSHNPFSLGISVDDNMESLFQNYDWTQINSPCNNEISKDADFLDVRSTENQSDLIAVNEIQSHDSDYFFTNKNEAVMPTQNSVVAANSSNQEYQENNANNNMQSLSMGNGGDKDSTSETNGDNSTRNNVEATSRRTSQNSTQRKSIYRGVTRHISTGRYEAHLWDRSSIKDGQPKKGYQGGYDTAEKAARAYDLAALKYWGESTTTNFPIGNYEKELEEMKNMTTKDFVATIKRKSSGFSRGASMYRGVTRHYQKGKWQAKLGRVGGGKDLYLGTFNAARAYDIAALKFKGPKAMTNFDISHYDVKAIIEGRTLPIKGGASKRLLGYMNMGSSSSVVDNNASDSNQWNYDGAGFIGNNNGLVLMTSNSSSSLMDNNGGDSNHWNYNGAGFIGNNNGLVLMTSNSSSSLMDNNGGDSNHWNYNGAGFIGNNIGLVEMTSNSYSSLIHNNGGDSNHWNYNGAGFIGNNNGLAEMASNSYPSLIHNNGGDSNHWNYNGAGFIGNNNGLVEMASNSHPSLIHNNGGDSNHWNYNGTGFIGNNNGLVQMTSNSYSSLIDNHGGDSNHWNYNGTGFIGNHSNDLVEMTSYSMHNNGGDSNHWNYNGADFIGNNNGLNGGDSTHWNYNGAGFIGNNNGLVEMTSNSSSSFTDRNGGDSNHWNYKGTTFIGNNNNDLVEMTSNSFSSLIDNNNGLGDSNNGLFGLALNSSLNDKDELSPMVDNNIATKGYSGWLMDSINDSNVAFTKWQ